MTLEERLHPSLLTFFDDWEVTEQIIDDKKAFYSIKKPNSEYQKVCLFRDGNYMTIYGDYGEYHFTHMSWLATPLNIPYDNLSYLMSKMSAEDREKAYEFDSDFALDDIFEWLTDRLTSHYNFEESIANTITSHIKETDWLCDELEYIQKNGFDGIEHIVSFVYDAIDHTDDKIEWISFLRNNDFSEYDEMFESELWEAGQRIDDRFLICLYALRKCGDKLANMENVKDTDDELATYKAEEEQGLLLRLPVALGSEVWAIIHRIDDFSGSYLAKTRTNFRLDMLDKIGKTIFLTEEEANKALSF